MINKDITFRKKIVRKIINLKFGMNSQTELTSLFKSLQECVTYSATYKNKDYGHINLTLNGVLKVNTHKMNMQLNIVVELSCHIPKGNNELR